MLSINTNISSLIAQSSMKTSSQFLNQAVERMTTGYKINHAKDILNRLIDLGYEGVIDIILNN